MVDIVNLLRKTYVGRKYKTKQSTIVILDLKEKDGYLDVRIGMQGYDGGNVVNSFQNIKNSINQYYYGCKVDIHM